MEKSVENKSWRERRILAPSILSADFGRLGEQLKEISEAGARYVHIDVMDGMFVPQITFGMPVIKTIRPYSHEIFDVHLMIQDPDRYVEDFKAAGADILTVHAEACPHLDRTIQHIHQAGMKAGVALNPATSLSVLDYVLEETDMVLIMTVNPGFGGQKYIPYCTGKVRELRARADKLGLDLDIEVDGGIAVSGTAQEVLRAGANVLVAGSAVFTGDLTGNVRDFLQVFDQEKAE